MSLADRPAPLDEELGDGDTARAETELPLSPAELEDFLGDVERLIRLNPQLAIASWQTTERGFRCSGHNESNDRAFDLGARVEFAAAGAALALRYDAGLKQATHLVVEPTATGARLVVVEHYPRIEDPDDPRVAEVDKSLLPWVAALRRHLLARQRWGRFPPWRWWTERFMPAMPPRQRRIVRLLIWSTVLEFVLFLGLVLVLRFAA